MKKFLLLVVILLAGILSAQAEGAKPIRIQLGWLNAEELRMEGCKPQSVILKAGSFVYFQLRKRPGEPAFKMTADWKDSAIALTLTKVSQMGDKGREEQSVSATLTPGETQNIDLAQFKFGVTGTEYHAAPKS